MTSRGATRTCTVAPLREAMIVAAPRARLVVAAGERVAPARAFARHVASPAQARASPDSACSLTVRWKPKSSAGETRGHRARRRRSSRNAASRTTACGALDEGPARGADRDGAERLVARDAADADVPEGAALGTCEELGLGRVAKPRQKACIDGPSRASARWNAPFSNDAACLDVRHSLASSTT